MRIRSTREHRILVIKTSVRWLLYYLVIFISFLIMTSGTLLKPILLVPIAICIAIDNNQYASVLTGVVSLLFELYLRHRFTNYILITAAVSYIQCRLDYKFYYQIWNYENVERIFTHVTLKVWVYTVISAVFVYFVIALINRFLMPKEHLTIEEAIKSN